MSNPYQFTKGEPGEGQTTASAPQGNGLAVAGLVLGIIALVLFWVPFLNWVLAILGIVFGAVGMSKGKKVGKGRGMGMAGLILGLISLIGGTIFFFYALKKAEEDLRRDFRMELRNNSSVIAPTPTRA